MAFVTCQHNIEGEQVCVNSAVTQSCFIAPVQLSIHISNFKLTDHHLPERMEIVHGSDGKLSREQTKKLKLRLQPPLLLTYNTLMIMLCVHHHRNTISPSYMILL